jgi:hypothetical protein
LNDEGKERNWILIDAGLKIICGTAQLTSKPIERARLISILFSGDAMVVPRRNLRLSAPTGIIY